MPDETILGLVVIVYLTALIALGVFMSKRVALASDFLVAGRNLGLLLAYGASTVVFLGVSLYTHPGRKVA